MEVPTEYSKLVVLVENNPVDAAVIARVFQATGTRHRLVHFADYQYARAHLGDLGRETPMLILLALNARDGNAFLFLELLKGDETLKMIPVVVLAASENDSDVAASFALGAAGYLVKSADPEKLHEDMTAIRTYWALSQSPRRP
jgi:DNA-binding NarL/FixJ family response regulator